MKWAVSTIIVFIVCAGCGANKGDAGKKESSSEPCTVADVEGGVSITCPDGSNAFVPNGKTGPKGDDGMAAAKCSITQVVYTCDDGRKTVLELHND